MLWLVKKFQVKGYKYYIKILRFCGLKIYMLNSWLMRFLVRRFFPCSSWTRLSGGLGAGTTRHFWWYSFIFSFLTIVDLQSFRIQNLEFHVWNSSCEMIIQAVGINLVRFKKWQEKRQAKSIQMWNQKEWIISLFFSSKGQLISKQNCRAIAFPKKQSKPTQNSILSAFGSFFGKSYSLAIFFRDLLPFRDFALMIFDTWN